MEILFPYSPLPPPPVRYIQTLYTFTVGFNFKQLFILLLVTVRPFDILNFEFPKCMLNTCIRTAHRCVVTGPQAHISNEIRRQNKMKWNVRQITPFFFFELLFFIFFLIFSNSCAHVVFWLVLSCIVYVWHFIIVFRFHRFHRNYFTSSTCSSTHSECIIQYH